MNATRSIRHGDTAAMRWTAAVIAFAVAAFLMLIYVRLLHESVERGAQLRYLQRDSRQGPSSITSDSSGMAVTAGTAAEIDLVGTNP